MPNFLIKTAIICLLVLSASFSQAQKNIVISQSLDANNEALKVKLGGQWIGKVWKIRFGEYAVVSSKLGWTTTTTRSNFFNTRTESKSTNKFSFVLAGKAPDSAQVNAASNMQVRALQEIEIFPNFSWGSNAVLQETNNFSAFITVNNDSTETWALLMNVTYGQNALEKYEAFLTNGDRRIAITPTSSNKLGTDNRPWPALGYEFIEDGEAIGALQYFGGGLLGVNKNIVWLHKDVPEKMKLVLAAAMTSVLQIKLLNENRVGE